MSRFRLDRRTLLRGAGSVAIALPWLEVMQPLKSSRAAGAPAKNFIAVYTPGGTVSSDWRSPAGASAVGNSAILLPLLGREYQLVKLQGLGLASAMGAAPGFGMAALLTGGEAVPSSSIDQHLAARWGTNVLYQAVRWATGSQDAGQSSRGNTVSYVAEGGALKPVLPTIDPVATWKSLFGSMRDDDALWRKSMLDNVLGRFNNLAQRLGADDRRRLEAHTEMLRDVEKNLGTLCIAPTLVDTSAYDPNAAARDAPATDAQIPVAGKLMMDMLVVALSCGITNVATLQWGDGYGGFTLPWLQLPGNRIQSLYDVESDRPSCISIHRWYSEQHVYLLNALTNVAIGDHSLLDETVVLFGSDEQSNRHEPNDIPFLLAAGGDRFQGNRTLEFGGRSHNDLLVSILNLCGDPVTSYGDARYSKGPLEGL
jgi:hypothetical protein